MQQRHLGKLFGLSVVTLGLYQIYWLVQTRRELRSQNIATPIPPVWGLFLPWAIMIAAYGIAHLANAGGAFGNGGGFFLNVLSTLSFAAFVAAFVVPAMWVWRYGKAVEELTGGETNHSFVFWLWIIGMPVWMIVMQHELNIVATNSTPAATPLKKKGKKL